MDVTRRHFGALSPVMDVPVLGGACSTDEHVLATPPGLTHAAIEPKRARANAMAEHVLPVSARAAGLLDDTRLGRGLEPYALEAIRAHTLASSARDDAFGTFRHAVHREPSPAGRVHRPRAGRAPADGPR